MSDKRDNLCSLTYTCMITVCYLGAIGLCRTVLFSNILKIDDKVINSVSLGIFSLIFLIGPFSLPFFQKMILKFTYKAVFFITSVANIFSMTLYIIVIEQQPKDAYLITTILIFEALSAPFMAIFYCSFNYYIRSMSNKNNVSIYFGVAYSLFCMQNFVGDIYVIFEEKIYNYNQYFYYPMLGVSLVITFLYWFIKEPDSLSKSVTKQSIDLQQKLNEHLYGSLMDDDNQKNNTNNNEYINQFKLIWKIPKLYPQFMYLIPTIVSIGMFTAFSVVYSQDMIEPNYTNVSYLKPAIVTNLSIHGVGQFLGGILIGFLSYSYGYLNLLIVLQLFGAATYVIVGEADEINNNKNSLVYTFNFMSGLQISAVQVLTFSYCGSEYVENKNVFQLCNWIYCWSFYFFTVVMSIPNIPGTANQYLIISVNVFGSFILAYCVLNFICLWFHKRKYLQLRENE